MGLGHVPEVSMAFEDGSVPPPLDSSDNLPVHHDRGSNVTSRDLPRSVVKAEKLWTSQPIRHAEASVAAAGPRKCCHMLFAALSLVVATATVCCKALCGIHVCHTALAHDTMG